MTVFFLVTLVDIILSSALVVTFIAEKIFFKICPNMMVLSVTKYFISKKSYFRFATDMDIMDNRLVLLSEGILQIVSK